MVKGALIMAKNYYAVIYEDGRSKIFIKLQDFKEAIDNDETRCHRGFYSYEDAKIWVSNPKGFPDKKTFYAVKIGRSPGIYRSKEEYHEQVDGYPNCLGKAFYTLKGAKTWLKNNVSESIDSQETSISVKAKAFFTGRLVSLFDGIKKGWQLRNILHDISQDHTPWMFCRIKTDHKLIIYTDASFRKKRGAGYAAAIIDCVTNAEFYIGGNSNEINNSSRAELYAIISALRIIDGRCRAEVEIRTDAQSIVEISKPINLQKFKSQGWTKAYGDGDLWKEFYGYTQVRNINVVWIRGHNGNAYNCQCDRIAKACL